MLPRAFEASGGTVVSAEIVASGEIVAFEGIGVTKGIGAFVASEASVVCQGIEASETETREAELVTKSVLAHPVENSTEANAVVGKSESLH